MASVSHSGLGTGGSLWSAVKTGFIKGSVPDIEFQDVRTFRKHLSKALDTAEAGGKVILNRRGQTYRLVAVARYATSSAVSTAPLTEAMPSAAALTEALGTYASSFAATGASVSGVWLGPPEKAFKDDPTVRFCEHGAGKGLCRKKACKFYQFKK